MNDTNGNSTILPPDYDDWRTSDFASSIDPDLPLCDCCEAELPRYEPGPAICQICMRAGCSPTDGAKCLCDGCGERQTETDICDGCYDLRERAYAWFCRIADKEVEA